MREKSIIEIIDERTISIWGESFTVSKASFLYVLKAS